MVRRVNSKLRQLDSVFLSLEPEQPASYYENINQLLKVFIQHPFIFNSLESLELLCNLLKQRVLELGSYPTRMPLQIKSFLSIQLQFSYVQLKPVHH